MITGRASTKTPTTPQRQKTSSHMLPAEREEAVAQSTPEATAELPPLGRARSSRDNQIVDSAVFQLRQKIGEGSIFIQARDPPVADKDRANFGVAAFRWRRHFEIENTDAPTLFAIV